MDIRKKVLILYANPLPGNRIFSSRSHKADLLTFTEKSTLTVTMEFRLSDHAAKRVQKRKVLIDWIQGTLDEPDKIESDPEDSRLTHALKEIPAKNFKMLRVIYNETTDPVTIVTVYFE